MPRFLLLRLEAPLMSFGREAIDSTGPTRETPDVSLLTGLIANALGWKRQERARHQRLQDRLHFGARIERMGQELHDFQTAALGRKDIGWTTRGVPEGRDGGESTYDSPHLRYRFYRADARILIALTLSDAAEAPTLDEIAQAFAEPARPLFIGRKPCLPSGPLALGCVETDHVIAALRAAPDLTTLDSESYVIADEDEVHLGGALVLARNSTRLTCRRDWFAGPHAGQETRIAITIGGGAA